jgi:hypothetical protein
LVFRAIPHRAMLLLCHRTMGTSMAHDSDIDDRGKLLCRKEAARYLTALGLVIAPQTLARKYHEGTGPLCTHVGVRAMYWQAHLDAYFKAQVSDAAAGSPRSKTRVKRAAVDPAPTRHAMASAPSSQASKEEVSDPAVSPPRGPAPLPVTTAPVATVAALPPAEPLAPASATPTKRKKPTAVAPLNQQELPF